MSRLINITALALALPMLVIAQEIREQVPTRIIEPGNVIRTIPGTAMPSSQRPVRPANPSSVKVARLKYEGGGDWYWGGSSIPNFTRFVRANTDLLIDTLEYQIALSDPDLFNYPFLFATGHGVMKFSPEDRERLRTYLNAGGFLFINDSYGMEKGVREELSRLFPERELVDLPFDHPIYHCVYDFSQGPPKIHEHDGKPPRGYGILLDGRVAVYLLVEADIGDGWEDQPVHNDPEEKRQQAFRMGVNILSYALLY